VLEGGETELTLARTGPLSRSPRCAESALSVMEIYRSGGILAVSIDAGEALPRWGSIMPRIFGGVPVGRTAAATLDRPICCGAAADLALGRADNALDIAGQSISQP